MLSYLHRHPVRSHSLSYQVAEAEPIGGAAVKCSNQADLHLTLNDPI